MLTRDWLISRARIGLFFIFFSVFITSCSFISNRILTKPVVKIAHFQLSAQDFSKELAEKLKDFDALSAKDPKIVDYFKHQIINDFLVSCLVDLWLSENKLSPSPDEVATEVAALIALYPSDAEFRELLSESGQSYSEWVFKAEQSLKKKKLLLHLGKDSVKPTENEILSFYNNNRLKYEQGEAALLSHILVDDLNQADVVKKLLGRQNFSQVAKNYSKSYNEESKDSYGWVERAYAGNLERAFKVRVGDVFGPIEFSGGVHIFKLVERRPHKIKTLAEVRPQVLSEINSLRESAKFSAWLDVQIKKYPIKKNSSVLDSIHIETR